jgi:hypothetical protein
MSKGIDSFDTGRISIDVDISDGVGANRIEDYENNSVAYAL